MYHISEDYLHTYVCSGVVVKKTVHYITFHLDRYIYDDKSKVHRYLTMYKKCLANQSKDIEEEAVWNKEKNEMICYILT